MAFAILEIDAEEANHLADGFRDAIADAGKTPNGVLLAAMAVLLVDMLGDEFEHLYSSLQTIAGLATHLNQQKVAKNSDKMN